MNKEAVELKLKEVKNPETNKSLHEEGRIVEFDFNGQDLLFTYKRDGITPASKRSIEDQVIALFQSDINEDNITVKTVSESSDDVYKSSATKKPEPQKSTGVQSQANLKVGHGPTGPQKKRVPNVKKVIAVSSAKGGVGKSTVAANLAVTLKEMGHSVGVIDADIYGPSMPLLFDVRDQKPMATEDKKIKPIDTHDLKLMSFGFFIGETDPVIWRGPMLGGVLNQFLFDCDWGELDYLIIDLPPGTGDIQLSLAQIAEIDGVVVVSTPEEIATLDARKGLEMFKQVKVPVLGVIENMSYFICDSCDTKHYIFGNGGLEQFSKDSGVPLFGKIPFYKGEKSKKIVVETPDSRHNSIKEVLRSYDEVAKSLSKSVGLKEKSKGFFSRLFS
ncbi:MAG: Mrp/NBP35 family ATP-binding protein [Bacteriovoracaceae bacterium]